MMLVCSGYETLKVHDDHDCLIRKCTHSTNMYGLVGFTCTGRNIILGVGASRTIELVTTNHEKGIRLHDQSPQLGLRTSDENKV